MTLRARRLNRIRPSQRLISKNTRLTNRQLQLLSQRHQRLILLRSHNLTTNKIINRRRQLREHTIALVKTLLQKRQVRVHTANLHIKLIQQITTDLLTLSHQRLKPLRKTLVQPTNIGCHSVGTIVQIGLHCGQLGHQVIVTPYARGLDRIGAGQRFVSEDSRLADCGLQLFSQGQESCVLVRGDNLAARKFVDRRRQLGEQAIALFQTLLQVGKVRVHAADLNIHFVKKISTDLLTLSHQRLKSLRKTLVQPTNIGCYSVGTAAQIGLNSGELLDQLIVTLNNNRLDRIGSSERFIGQHTRLANGQLQLLGKGHQGCVVVAIDQVPVGKVVGDWDELSEKRVGLCQACFQGCE